MAEIGGDLVGWLSKFRKGLVWDRLEERYFSLCESSSSIHDSEEVQSDLGCLNYYLSDQSGTKLKGSYYICKDTVCNAVPTKPGFKNGFGFFIRGILNQGEKQLILVASTEAIRDEWVERINSLIANKDIYAGWLLNQPTMINSNKQFCVVSIAKRDKAATLGGGNNIKLGSLTFYKDDRKGKIRATYNLYKNTQCLPLNNDDSAIPSSHRNLFPFMLCNRTDAENFENFLVCIAESKQEREAWIREINQIVDFKIAYSGKIVKKGRSSLAGDWKSRFAIVVPSYIFDGTEAVQSGNLIYYEDDTFECLKKAKGHIELTKNCSVEKLRAFDSMLPKGSSGFGVIIHCKHDGGNRDFIFMTDTEKEREKIVKECNSIIGEFGGFSGIGGASSPSPRKGNANSTNSKPLGASGYGGSDSSSTSSSNSNAALKDSAATWKKGGARRKNSAQASPNDTESVFNNSSNSRGSKQGSNDDLMSAASSGPSINAETVPLKSKKDDNPDIVDEEPLPKGWKKEVTADGKVYYYEVATRVSRWDRPTAEIASKIQERELENQRRVEEALRQMREQQEANTSNMDAKSKAVQEMKETVNMVIDSWRFYDPGLADREQFRNYRSLPELMALLPTICSIVPEKVIMEGIEDSVDPSTIKKQYMKIVRIIHPDKLPASITVEQRVLLDEVLLILSDSYDSFKAALD